jgi:hypothetical protein
MNRQQAKEHLLQGKTLLVDGIWYYTEFYMTCGNEDCCSEHFDNIEECLDYLGDDLEYAEVME